MKLRGRQWILSKMVPLLLALVGLSIVFLLLLKFTHIMSVILSAFIVFVLTIAVAHIYVFYLVCNIFLDLLIEASPFWRSRE